jgi:AcrR family transcriptional regulator
LGNREALLAAAKRCLLEIGFSRTTARDIAGASGVSLAAIGYHFGTKENLLTIALLSALEELDVEFRKAANAQRLLDTSPTQRFEAVWNGLIASFSENRQLWTANLEIFSQVERIPALRTLIDEGLLQRARAGLVSLFEGVDETKVDERSIATRGSFYYALLGGVLMQTIMDPQRAPSARSLTEAVVAIAAGMNSVARPDPE